MKDNSNDSRELLEPDDRSVTVDEGIPLIGQVDVSGSKHSILHILGALWLLEGELVIRNTPNIWDVRYFLEIYKSLGMRCRLTNGVLRTTIPSSLTYTEEKMNLASKIRSSILLLGSLLARNGFVRLPVPTGDRIGNRPFAEFFAVLEYFGISYSMQNGHIEAKFNKPLQGNRVIDLYSHGNNRTALAIILAVANAGKTVLTNPLPQPEIMELCAFLDSFVCPISVESYLSGAIKITVESEGNIPVRCNGSFSIGPDKCELGFWIAVTAITQGVIECHTQSPVFSNESLGPLAGIRDSLLNELGIPITITDQNSFVVDGQRAKLKSVNLMVPHNKELTTGLAIDVCPQFIPLMTLASGKSSYRDCKYGASRVQSFLQELRKLGMVVSIRSNTLEVQGRNELHGAEVEGNDIRGAATLLVASLGALGRSNVGGVFHINRGYCDIVSKLQSVGASITRKE